MKLILVAMLVASLLAAQQADAAGVVETQFRLNFSISVGDRVFVGDTQSPATGAWYSNNLTKRALCAQNSTIKSTPVSLSVLSGGGFRNLNYTSASNATVRLTQDYGQPFYLVFTNTNCTATINNAPAVEDGRVGVFGSRPDVDSKGVLAYIPYPRINFTQSLRLPGGVWDVIVENNGTSKNATRIKVTLA